MSFDEAMATQPAWVRYWVLWMGVVIMVSIVALVFSKATRRDALVLFVVMIAAYAAMMWLFQKVGFVRLLGIVHVVLWTPLAIYFWTRLRDPAIVAPFRQVILLLLATFAVSLAFDYVDVVRYALGERVSMIR